ncbi:iron-siderophore ABC transporter substrate-binding protein [Demequina sp.]|uniref:iron-siderophore ABC transporter substrate-binding protein n=1 Tax=Demequina sp. TaxID=2050685 RepID=UPI003D0DA3FE
MKTSRLAGLAIVAVAAMTLAACSSDAEPSETAGGTSPTSDAPAAEFPITIEHAYGETVIETKPERVATVAWSNGEVPLALGVVPVGMAAQDWGDDNGNGIMPWVEEQLTELGAEAPTLFDETDGIDFEAVAATEPDLILATYSGLTQEEYDTLSQIAPTVAYPEFAWGTTWQDQILISSKALGLASEGEALVDELNGVIADSLATHQELVGTKTLFSWVTPADPSTIGFYTLTDTRPGFLDSVGIPAPQVVVDTTAADPTQFYSQISAEDADQVADAGLIITYGDDSTLAGLQADPILGTIPAIKDGHVAVLADSTPLAASANPSPLSIEWGIDDYFALLAAPLK